MKILHVIDSGGLYGAETVLLHLTRGLLACGHTPLLASIGTPGCGEKNIERSAAREGVEVFPLRAMAGPNPALTWRLLSLCRSQHVDLVHTHGYRSDILVGLVPRPLRRIPAIATVHGYTHAGGAGRMSLYIFVDRLALARMDHVVLVHAALAGRFGGLAMSRRFTVIENGVFAGEGATAPDALDPRIAEFCGQRPILGAVGRLSTEKDHATLVEAFGLLIASGLDARLVIIGEGPERPRLEALAQRLGVSDRVLLPGFVPSARAYMPLFDVFVLPSLTEGLPLTLLEAMLAGTPVIATPVGGVPHTLEDGDSGLIVPPGDPDALERALRRMLAGPDFARGLAARARRQVETRFTGAVMVQRYVDLYERLLALARHHGDES